MPTASHDHRRLGAFTLMEMMVVSAILGLVAAYMMQTLTHQQNAYVVTENVTEAQQSLRLVSDLMEREIRVAGYMVPPAGAACAADFTGAPDTLYVSAADKIRTVEDLESADLNLVRGNLGAEVSAIAGFGTPRTETTPGAPETIGLARSYVDVAADGVDFADGEGVILVDLNNVTGPVACGRITSIASGCTTATSTCSLAIQFEATNMTLTGADIVAIPAHVYRILPATATKPAQLFRDGDLMAGDVEDLQVVFYYDDNGDRIVDAGEVFGEGATRLPATAATDHSELIEIRLNVTTATRVEDPNDDFAGTRLQSTGNRTAATTGDRKRRRVHQSTVRLRNLG